MANEEHLEILWAGVAAWNDWREEKSEETPDLSGANLSRVNLSGAHLNGADLSGTHLTMADLHGAVLSRADLHGADLVGANLRGVNLSTASLIGAELTEAELAKVDLPNANLVGADLTKANLRGADLRKAKLKRANLNGADLSEVGLGKANLVGTNLTRVNLSGAVLTGAIMGDTVFFQANLKRTEGLNTITHRSASNLDHFTIARSDPLPISFLRGCGLPELIINNTEALRGDPFEFYSCFISHSSNDQDFADRLYADLQDEGVRCWYAPQDLRGGKKTHRQIEEAIRHHDKLVLILSEASMKSNWVEHEIREARKRERKEDRQVLFPISLVSYSDLQDWTLFDADEGRDLAQEVREYYIPDFSNWKDHDEYSEAFDELFRGLKEKS